MAASQKKFGFSLFNKFVHISLLTFIILLLDKHNFNEFLYFFLNLLILFAKFISEKNAILICVFADIFCWSKRIE